MNRWSPERVAVLPLPGNFSGKDRRGFAIDARFVPFAIVPLPYFADRMIAVAPAHSSDADALLGDIPSVVSEEEVKPFLLFVQYRAKIAMSSCKIAILCATIDRRLGCFQDYAQVLPSFPIVMGTKGADLWCCQVGSGEEVARLEVIPSVKRPILGLPSGLDPTPSLEFVVEADRLWLAKIKKAFAGSAEGTPNGVKDEEDIAIPMSRAI